MLALWKQVTCRRLDRFRSLPHPYQRTLFTSFLVLVSVRLGLGILRYNRLRRMIRQTAVEPPDELLDMLGWCIPKAARFVWRASCLTQALSMQIMLARKGYFVEMRIGARRDTHGVFQAHAWLLSKGRVVLGGTEDGLAGFSQFNSLSASD